MAKLFPQESKTMSVDKVERTQLAKLFFQIKLLLWKRYLENTKSKWEILKVIIPCALYFSLVILIYNSFDIFVHGALERFLIPQAFWIYITRIVVQIMFEKSSRLQESMRMMGLSDFAYWMSYFIAEGVVVGFMLSLLGAIISTGEAFPGMGFGNVLGLLFVYCLSVTPFAFFLCSFFDTPQTSGQATLGLLLGTTHFPTQGCCFCTNFD